MVIMLCIFPLFFGMGLLLEVFAFCLLIYTVIKGSSLSDKREELMAELPQSVEEGSCEYECTNCGASVKEDDRFCPQCGDSVEELEIESDVCEEYGDDIEDKKHRAKRRKSKKPRKGDNRN